MLDGLFIGLGIAAAGWFIARRLPQSREALSVSVPEAAELAKALRYMAKSARGGVRRKEVPPPPPDPREAKMTAWLSRNPQYVGVEREHLMAAWHYAVGIIPGSASDVSDSIATLNSYGAPLPSELDT